MPTMPSGMASLRQASLAILIVLIVQFALGIGVNLPSPCPGRAIPGTAHGLATARCWPRTPRSACT